MKQLKLIALTTFLALSSHVYTQTGLSTTIDLAKLGYGLNFKQGNYIATISNGTYHVSTDRVSILKVGSGYVHYIPNGNCLYFVPQYNVFYNKSDEFYWLNEDKFWPLTVELGAGVMLGEHLEANIFTDVVLWEVRFGFGWEF